MTAPSSDHAASSAQSAVPAAADAAQSSTRSTPLSPVTLSAASRKNPQQSVPSPCVGVCKMDAAKGWCAGCFRTLDEIAAWSRATDATKRAVWSLVEARQA